MPITTCAVSGYIYDPFGVALPNQTVTFVPRDWVAGADGIVAPKNKTATTSGTGYLSSIPLIPGVYKVIFADPAIAGRTQFTISVPTTATASLQNIADFTGQTRQAGFLDGSAGAPVWTFVNDTDTGLYRVSSNTIGFSTGGSTTLTLGESGAVLSGLLSGTAITQNSKDNTTGRILKVGDFGLGADTSPNVTGLNLTGDVQSGFYQTYQNNNPEGLNFNGFLVAVTAGYDAASKAQGYLHWNKAISGSMRPQILSYQPSTDGWNKERLVTYTNLLGAVSQVGGDPTGAVIESGSNANGAYVRFADGTQICHADLTVTDCNSVIGALYESAAVTWTFPAAFAISSPTVSVFGDAGTARESLNAAPATTTSVTLRVVSPISVTGAIPMRPVAIGRWF